MDHFENWVEAMGFPQAHGQALTVVVGPPICWLRKESLDQGSQTSFHGPEKFGKEV